MPYKFNRSFSSFTEIRDALFAVLDYNKYPTAGQAWCDNYLKEGIYFEEIASEWDLEKIISRIWIHALVCKPTVSAVPDDDGIKVSTVLPH